jgi:release factor glutamine methyltransferase
VTRGELITELADTLGLRHEARFIVDEVLGRGAWSGGRAVGTADIAAARRLAERRLEGEPIQYIFGHWAFRQLDLVVDRRVLIPRPETEQLVEVALAELRQLGAVAPNIVDAGTGSGAIALSLATELAADHPDGRLWAVDISADALAVTRDNLERTRRQVGRQSILPVTLVEGSWLGALPAELQGSIDLVVSNPPYVAMGEWASLDDEVRCEPLTALVAAQGSDGTPGLGDVEAVLAQARSWLARPGAVVIELAPAQAEPAMRLARSMGYGDVRVEPDLARRPRTLVGRSR